MIDVAFCITELHPGGAEQALVELATRIDRRRFSPSVYSLGPRPPDDAAILCERLASAEVPVQFMNGRRAWHAPAVVARLARHWRNARPDVVQTFLFHANLAGRLAARLAGTGRVVSGVRVAERQAAWHILADRFSARFVDRVVCVSESVAEFCRAAGLPAERLRVVHNGVDADRFSTAEAADLAKLGVPAGQSVLT